MGLTVAEQVQRLLAVAADPRANPNEREMAETQAARLIARHDLDVARLTPEEGTRFVTLVWEVPQGLGPRMVASAACTRARCEYHWQTRRGRRGSTVLWTAYGTPLGVEFARTLYDRWMRQLAHDIATAKEAGHIYGRADFARYREGWAAALAARARKLADTLDADLEDSGPGTALVLVDRLTSAYAAAFPKTKGRNLDVDLGQASVAAGARAGFQVALSDAAGTAARGELL